MSSTELDTRKRILQETWNLMEHNRGLGVRLEDVAKAAHVSRQAVYMHFGSRTGLLIATARYVDDVLGLQERLLPVVTNPNGVESMDAFVEFWANYIPDLYGIAKAFLAVRDTDQDAAAAWDDRMRIMYEGCLNTIQCLQREGTLSPEWTVNEAADLFWSILAIPVWENLTIERGWSKEQYIKRIQLALRQMLVNKG